MISNLGEVPHAGMQEPWKMPRLKVGLARAGDLWSLKRVSLVNCCICVFFEALLISSLSMGQRSIDLKHASGKLFGWIIPLGQRLCS